MVVMQRTSLVDALIDIGTIVDRAFELRLKSLNLSTAQLRILEALAEERREVGEGVQPKTLAAMLIQEPHSVSGLLNRLEDRELIERVRDRQDRRMVWARLTPAGVDLVAKAEIARDLTEAAARASLDRVRNSDERIDNVYELALAWRSDLRALLAAPTPLGRIAI